MARTRIKNCGLRAVTRLFMCATGLMGYGAAHLLGQQSAPVVVTPTAVITGRVLSADGTPIRGADVRVQAEDGRDSRSATTDAQGGYEIRDLTPGLWSIQAAKAGYVTQRYGQDHPLDSAMPTRIADGQRLTAHLTLMRGGAIAGQVLDAFGEPVLDARVRLMRARVVRGLQQVVAAGSEDRTDDTGAFRIYGLVPGEYYVSAAVPVHESTPTSSTPDFVVFFPGSLRVSAAQRVTVVAGQEQLGLTIVAPPPLRGVRVSGLVVNSQGAPAAGAAVYLYDMGDFASATSGRGIAAVTNAQGQFSAENVAPGSYVADVMLTRGGPAGFEYAAVPIGVGGTDVTSLTLSTRPAVTLQAAVVASPPGTALPEPLLLQVTAEGTGSFGRMVTEHPVLWAADGNAPSARTGGRPMIEIPGLHGRMHLSVSGLPTGWVLEALEIDGRDASTTAVDFTTLGSSVPARIVITNRTAAVTGTVASRGQRQGGHVVVFPENPARWGYPAPRVKSARVSQEGRFAVEGLLPGERYRAVAVAVLEPGDHQDPELLERLKNAGASFDAVAGQTTTLELGPVVTP